MISELADMQSRASAGATQIDFSASGRKTKRLIHAEGLSMELGGRALFRSLNLTSLPVFDWGSSAQTAAENNATADPCRASESDAAERSNAPRLPNRVL